MQPFSTAKTHESAKCQHKWVKARDVTIPLYWSNMSISYLCLNCKERVIPINHVITEIENTINLTN